MHGKKLHYGPVLYINMNNQYSDKTFYWHYAWVIVFIIFGMQIVGSSIRMAFGVFVDPLEQRFAWSQSNIGIAYAVGMIVTAISSPWAGNLGDRLGAKKTMYFGIVLFLVGMIMTALIREWFSWQFNFFNIQISLGLLHFWISYGVILGVAQSIFLVPLIPAAMIWFRRHLGLAMGLIMTSWGVGPAIATPLVAILVDSMGWRNAFLSIGFGSSLLMMIMVFYFRDRPSDIGVLEYGSRPGDEPISTSLPPIVLLNEFHRHMKKTAAYWNMSSIHFLGCVGHAVILIWIIPFATTKGLTVLEASLISSLMAMISVSTRLATPMLCERFGVRSVMTIFYVLQGLPVLILFFTSIPFVFILFAITFGIGYGGETGGFPILNRKYFGHAPMGRAHGFQMLGAGIGMALGGWVGGPIYDISGSYNWALAISVVASLGGAISIVLLESTSKLLIPDWKKAEKSFLETKTEAN